MALNSAVKKVVTVISVIPIEVVNWFALEAKKRVPRIARSARTANKGQSQKYMIDEKHLPFIHKELLDKV